MTSFHWHGYGQLLMLFLRRNLAPSALLVSGGLMLIAATRDWAPPHAVAEVLDSGTGAHLRQAVWAVALLFSVPILMTRAAASAQRWRAGDADWLAALPLPRLQYTIAVTLGTWGGVAAVLCLATTIAEVFAQDSNQGAMRIAGAVEHPAFMLVEGDPKRSIVWRQPGLGFGDLAPGARLAMRPTVALGSGPALSVRVTLEAQGQAPQVVERRIFGRTRIELPIPPRGANTTLSIERMGPGAVFVLPPRALELLLPAASARSASYAMALRLGLALIAWTTLAAGLGAWMRSGLASSTCIVLWILPIVSGRALEIVPGAGLWNAWTAVGNGLVPAHLDSAVYVGTLVSVILGVALFQLGIHRGRGMAQ